ncbi:unnamed protein product [Boreogadus saida]
MVMQPPAPGRDGADPRWRWKERVEEAPRPIRGQQCSLHVTSSDLSMESSAGGRKRLRRPLLGRSLFLSPSAMLPLLTCPATDRPAKAGGELLFTSTQSRGPPPLGLEPLVTRNPEEPSVTRNPEEPSVTRNPEEPSVTRNPEEPSVTRNPEEPSVTWNPEEPSVTRNPEEPSVTRNPLSRGTLRNPLSRGTLCHEEP